MNKIIAVALLLATPAIAEPQFVTIVINADDLSAIRECLPKADGKTTVSIIPIQTSQDDKLKSRSVPLDAMPR